MLGPCDPRQRLLARASRHMDEVEIFQVCYLFALLMVSLKIDFFSLGKKKESGKRKA